MDKIADCSCSMGNKISFSDLLYFVWNLLAIVILRRPLRAPTSSSKLYPFDSRQHSCVFCPFWDPPLCLAETHVCLDVFAWCLGSSACASLFLVLLSFLLYNALGGVLRLPDTLAMQSGHWWHPREVPLYYRLHYAGGTGLWDIESDEIYLPPWICSASMLRMLLAW